MDEAKAKQTKFTWIAQILLVQLVLILLAYPLVHELGHSLAVLLAGGKVTGISLGMFEAHMDYEGILSASANGIVSVMGVLLPYLCYIVFLVFVKKHASPLVQKIKWCALFVVLGALSVWIVLPLMSYFGPVPAGDDVTQALRRLSCEPALLSVFAAALFVLCVAIFLKKGGSFYAGLDIKRKDATKNGKQ